MSVGDPISQAPAGRDIAWWREFVEGCPDRHFAAAIRKLIDSDPDVLLAVDEVDTSLIESWAAMSVEDRIRYAVGTAMDLERCRGDSQIAALQLVT